MNKVVVVLCEGQHDIAFISRVLKANNFLPYNKKIKQFQQPLNSLFEQTLKAKTISDKKLGFQSDYLIPSVALSNDTTLVLFHSMGGDARTRERGEVLEMYQDLSGDDDFSQLDFSLRFVICLDADDVGVSNRLDELSKEIGLEDNFEQGKIINFKNFEYGAFIYHDGNDTGCLEDVLLKIVKKSEPNILDGASRFLEDNKLDAERTREHVCTASSQVYKGSSKYKDKKSILSVAGQLQFSGMNNSVFIANTDYITYKELTIDDDCKLILGLFENS